MTSSETTKTRALKFQHALRLRMAEYWLALGQVEEALEEFSQLPMTVRTHPEVVRMRARFECLPAQVVEMWLSNPRLSHPKNRKRSRAMKSRRFPQNKTIDPSVSY